MQLTTYISKERQLVLRIVLVQEQKFAVDLVATVFTINDCIALLL